MLSLFVCNIFKKGGSNHQEGGETKGMKEIEVNELMHAVHALEESKDANILQNVIGVLKNIIENANQGSYRNDDAASGMVKLEDLNAYMAHILWKESDLEMFFEEFADPREKPSEKNKRILYENLDVDALVEGSISKGWEYFQHAYDVAVTKDVRAFISAPTKKEIEQMALEIRNLLRSHGIWQDTIMFYNDKEVSSDRKADFYQLIREESAWYRTEECPEKRIYGVEEGTNIFSMIYEGPLMHIINCDRNDAEAEEVRENLKKIFNEYGLWYECQNGYSFTCYLL